MDLARCEIIMVSIFFESVVMSYIEETHKDIGTVDVDSINLFLREKYSNVFDKLINAHGFYDAIYQNGIIINGDLVESVENVEQILNYPKYFIDRMLKLDFISWKINNALLLFFHNAYEFLKGDVAFKLIVCNLLKIIQYDEEKPLCVGLLTYIHENCIFLRRMPHQLKPDNEYKYVGKNVKLAEEIKNIIDTSKVDEIWDNILKLKMDNYTHYFSFHKGILDQIKIIDPWKSKFEYMSNTYIYNKKTPLSIHYHILWIMVKMIFIMPYVKIKKNIF